MTNTQELILIYFLARTVVISISILNIKSLMDNEDIANDYKKEQLIRSLIAIFLGPLVIFPLMYSFFKKVFTELTK